MWVVMGRHSFCLLQGLEPVVHGRGRKDDSLDETYLGVYEELLYARKIKPVEGEFLKLTSLTNENTTFIGSTLVTNTCPTSTFNNNMKVFAYI